MAQAVGDERVKRGRLGLCVVAVLLAPWCARARGADPPAPRAPAVVAEVGPEIYYLEDEAGRLVPVPGFGYRDFMELFRLREGLPAALEPPAAVLENLVVRCDLSRADAAVGTCPATIEVTVRQTRPGWTSVPLGLDGLVLAGPPRHEGAGRVVVEADPAGGYRGWFDLPAGGGDTRHAVVLEGAVSAELTAVRDTLHLRLPVAAAATIELRTAREGPEAIVLPVPPARPSVAPQADGTSVVSIAGVAGPVRIRLAAAGSGDAAWDAVPQATVESVVRIDGRSAAFDAAIRLENLGPDTRTIDVALPPRSVLRGVKPPASLVARGGTADAPSVTLAIERERDGHAVAHLECERPVDPAGGAAFEAIGFTVGRVESWRQWGRVSLAVEGDWRIEWTDHPGVRRVDPPPAARRPGFVAAFAYDALPAALPVRVRPRVSRVVVEPEYRYDVGPTRVALAATLRVVARGAPAASVVLEVDPAFDIDEVGPPGVVDVGAVSVEAGRVTIPFLQPLSGDAVIEVRGNRWIDRDATALGWQLPVLRADVVAPARVLIASDTDIEILPDAAASVGLVRQIVSGRGGAGAEATLVYRLDGASGTFAATRRYLARRIDAAVDVKARIDDSETEVVETIRLDVAHVPLEYLDISVPESVAATSTLEVRQEGVALDPFVVSSEDRGTAAAAAPADDGVPPPQRLRALLLQPLIGTGEVTVTFRLPTPAVPAETTVATHLPLALPAGALVERQTVAVEAAARLAVEVRGDGWRPDATADAAAPAWTATRPQDAVPLALATRRRAAIDAVAEATWLRTHLLPDRREDVATFVLSGAGDGVTLTVPAAADARTCTVVLDGVPLPAIRDDAGRFTVTLPRAAAAGRRVLEVRTTTPRASGWAALGARIGLPERIRLEPPVFAGGVAQRRFFQEIVARPDEHVLGAPDTWTAQQQWRLGPAGFERVPVVAPAAVAAWIQNAAGSATRAEAEPPLVARRTLYSGMGPPGAATLWLVPTWFAVLVASGATLGAGLALAYVAAARRPVVVVPLVALLGLAAAALPDLAPLVMQAALPGAGLSLLAWGLRACVDREPSRRGMRQAAPAASASSLTRVMPAPSLLINGSAVEREGSVTAGGRSAP